MNHKRGDRVTVLKWIRLPELLMKAMTLRFIPPVVARLALALALLLPLLAFAGPFTKIYVFGDSLSDSGRAFALTNGSFPLSPPYYQGRFSNGPVWSELLSPVLGVAYASATNYAVGGAKSDNTNTRPNLPGLTNEIDNFLGANPVADGDALYCVWVGANDLLASFTPPVVIVGNIVTAINRLYQAGARNIAVGGMPDLGLTPGVKASGAGVIFSYQSADFNNLLRTSLAGLAYPVTFVDFMSLMQKVMASPATYGLQNITDSCLSSTGSVCANPDTYLFWDDIHPTAVGHKLLTAQFLDATGIARYDTAASLLRIPSVSVPGGTYEAELQFEAVVEDNFSFRLLPGSTLPLSAGTHLAGFGATFDPATGTLTLPIVQVDGLSYRASMNFVAPDRFSMNPSGVSSR